MPGPVQWGADQLVRVLKSLEEKARLERVHISENNARLMALDTLSKGIADPARRAAVQAQVKRGVRRQETIVRAYRTFVQKFTDVSQRARAFLDQHGLTSSSGLAGLGIAPALILVPVVVVGAVLVANAMVSWLEKANAAQNGAIQIEEQAAHNYTQGKITREQYLEIAAHADALYKAKGPLTDPFGLSSFTEALIPIGIIAVLLVLGPQLLRLLSPRTARA